jgi:hypothetical protein
MGSSVALIRTTFTISGMAIVLYPTKPQTKLDSRWLSFDPARNYPDLGSRFVRGETLVKENLVGQAPKKDAGMEEDPEDLSWAAVLKRTFEAFVRGERPNMYGEWIEW